MASNRKVKKERAMTQKRRQRAQQAIKRIQTLERGLAAREHHFSGKELQMLALNLSKNTQHTSKRKRRQTRQNVLQHAEMMDKLRSTGVTSREMRQYSKRLFGKDITRLSTFNNNVGSTITRNDIQKMMNASVDGKGSLYNDNDISKLSKELSQAHNKVKEQDYNDRLKKRALDQLPTKDELRRIVKEDGIDAANQLLNADITSSVIDKLIHQINEAISELRERAAFVDNSYPGILERLGLQEMMTVDFESFNEMLVEQWQGAIQDAGDPSFLRGLMSLSYAILDMKDELK